MLADLNYHPFTDFVLFNLPERGNTPAAANAFAVVIKGFG
jgi:hypothetical protein